MSVKSRAKEEVTQALDATHFVVSVKAAPVDGKANEAVRRALALYLGISPSLLRLKSGAKDKHKVFLLSGLV